MREFTKRKIHAVKSASRKTTINSDTITININVESKDGVILNPIETHIKTYLGVMSTYTVRNKKLNFNQILLDKKFDFSSIEKIGLYSLTGKIFCNFFPNSVVWEGSIKLIVTSINERFL